jgi:sugar phosphate isomerase/epimerase
LSRLRAQGFDGIELWPDPLRKFGPGRWAAALQAANLSCLQLCPYFDFVHGPDKIAASRLLLREYLDYARLLGCRRLRVFTGPPWGEGVIGARVASATQWAAAITELRAFCDIAAREDVELCLECHEGSLMEDSVSALRLLEAVSRPNLTTNLQLPLVGEPWQFSLQNLAPYTSHIHIHNWEKEMVDVSRATLTFLDAGIFDWVPVVRKIVLDCGRSLCLSVEHTDHGGRHDPWETACRDGPYLQRLRREILGESL